MGKGDRKSQGISAAKAAEALSRTAGGAGFGGFSGSTPPAPGGFSFGAKYVSTVQAAVGSAGCSGGSGGGAGASDAAVRGAAIIPADLDGELAQQLQKLSKRDATTKLKALQALKALVKEKPAVDVQAALPSWAYLFSRLVLDNNRGVRAEACHVTAAMAAAVGRGIAPLLKSLLPSWWLAQHDGYTEAAAAARAAFAAAFPTAAKQRDAVLYCRAEVLQLLGDNLASTPQSLGDAKKESVEELQDRQERVLAASCSALAALLDLAAPPASAAEQAAAPAAAEQELLDGIRAELDLPAFYKTALQSKAAPVRRAAYGLVAAAAERAPARLLAGGAAHTAPAVLGALADKEAGNHEAMWGMLLAYARALPDSWRHISMQKSFLPRLWAFLRHSCYGSATGSYPALLPLVSLLPQEALGPRPTFFVSLLESIWQGLASLAAGALGGRLARQAAAAAYQDCLLYALLKADSLAAVGGDGSTAGSTSPGQQYSSEVLQAALSQALMPAVTAASAGAAAVAPEAEAVLTGAVARLGQPAASASSGQRLEALLQLVGSSLASALQDSLSGGGGSEPFDRCAALVAALEKAAGMSAGAVVGAAVAQPLVALLLPEVRSGTAPPAASSLLAALLKSFPQHAAAEAAGTPPASEGAACGPGESGEGQPPPSSSAAGVSDEVASLRLHQSASFTIESVLRRLCDEQQPEAAAASCDLLLSCLPQVHHPLRKLADVLLQLLERQQASTAALLLEHLVSGQHPELAVAACRSAELDRVSAMLAGSGGPSLAIQEAAVPRLLALLLAGDGRSSLLSEAAQAALLEHLVQVLQTAQAELEQAGGEAADVAAAAAAAAVLQALQAALLSPALDARCSSQVLGLRLQLLATAFRLLLHDAATEAEAAAAEGGSQYGAASFVDESDAESVELPQQPGAAAVAAQQLWQQPEAIAGVLGSAAAEQRGAFVTSVQHAVESVLLWHGSPAAALAAAEAAGPLLAVLGSSSELQQQLLQALVGQPQQQEDAASSSSSSKAHAYSEAEALFLAAVGAAAGFDSLLPPSNPGSAAHAAVSILAALQADPAAARQQQEQLLDYVAGAVAGTLLQRTLQVAAATASSPGHAAVLCALLRAATGGGSTSLAAAARFFASAAGEGAQLPMSPALLRQLLPVVAPVFRCSTLLLQQSALPTLSQQLCRLSNAADPVALLEDGSEQQAAAVDLLLSAVACFPCTTGAEAAAQLPAPGAATAAGQETSSASSTSTTSSYAKGDKVWYRQQDGGWLEAEVTAVDTSVQPPSYGVKFDGAAYRETEASRLRPRQPGAAPPPSAVPAAAAAERQAAGASALPPAGSCTAEEQAALVQLLQHQARGAKGAAAAARLEAAAGAARASAEPTPPAVAAAVAALLHAAVAYASQQLSQQQWGLLLEQLRAAFGQCAAALSAAAGQVAATVCAAAAEIAVGADMQSPAVALQFFRRLKLRGVLERSAKAQAEAARVTASLEAQLVALDELLLPLLMPTLQAYTRAAAVAGTCRSLSERDWQAAEAAVCSDALQLFVTAGSIAAAAGVSGAAAADELAGWMCGRRGEEGAATAAQSAAAWQLLSQHVASTLRAADRAFLLAAVDRANGGMDSTGVDALGSLLALSLSGIPPPSMAAAAFSAILQHTELTASLTAAEGVDEDQLMEEQRQQGAAAAGGSGDGADAAALLEQVGVRPELAAAVAGGGAGAGFFTGWALLLAHVLAAPAESHGRRLLVQAVKDAHALVPALLDALVPLLPLDAASSSRRESSGGTPGARRAVAAPTTSGTATPSSSSGSDGGGGGFAAQLLAVGPYPVDGGAGSSDGAGRLDAEPSGAAGEQQQRRQRFAVLLYSAVLQALPASARLWFADLRDRGTAGAVERYTSAAVSGELLSAEFAAVTQAASAFGKFDKFSVRANSTSREVIAVMEVEDGHLLELAVKLPASMPLRLPELECRRKVGVSEGRLRKWLLSISAFLRMQNGSVAEAISLWKRNVDKEFEGQEECLICYSIVQHTSGQLPRLSCRTCRKRFHGGCLYKWFKSSGKSTCPHCQSPW